MNIMHGGSAWNMRIALALLCAHHACTASLRQTHWMLCGQR